MSEWLEKNQTMWKKSHRKFEKFWTMFWLGTGIFFIGCAVGVTFERKAWNQALDELFWDTDLKIRRV